MSDFLKKQILNAIDSEDQCHMLARHMPKGEMWVGARDADTNIGKLVCGLAVEYYRLGVLIEEEIKEFDIDQTVNLLEEWEQSVGIPSSVFDIDGVSIENRRKNIKYLFTNFWGVQTAGDFETVASFFDFNVKVEPANKKFTFPLEFPIYFFTDLSVLFSIIVMTESNEDDRSYFPLYFPYYFSDGGIDFLRRLFELLAPAHAAVRFINDFDYYS